MCAMKVLVVSNMYPDNSHPFYGTFVKKFTDELEVIGIDYSKSVMYQSDNKMKKAINYILFYVKTYCKIIFNSYDIVYVHYASHSSAPVLLAKRIKQFMLFINVHGSDVVPENKKQEKFQKYTVAALNMSNKIIVPSEYFRDYIVKKYDLNIASICVYPSGGIDTNIFYKKSSGELQEFKQKYGIKDEIITFGMAGRIAEGKGWDTFLHAVSLAQKSKLHANFVYVGNGREEEQFNSLVKELGIEDCLIHINLLPQDQLATFYSAIDFLIFPTKREGESLGLVPLEAMACGTPVISSDFAAPRYYINDQNNGYKFPVNDYDALFCIMKKVINIDMHEMRTNAQITASNYYTEKIRTVLVNLFKVFY